MGNRIGYISDANGDILYPYAYAQGGMKRDLLWTNSNPTSAFPSRTINVDTTPYDYFIFVMWGHINADRTYQNLTVFKDDTVLRILMRTGDIRFGTRSLSITDNGISIGDLVEDSYNNWCIPQKIYGIKTSYLVPTEVHGLTYLDDDTNGNITLYNNDGTKALYPKGQVGGIDETRLLAKGNLATFTNQSYTASEDCYVVFVSRYSCAINGVEIFLTNNLQYPMACFLLKKGQTFNCPAGGTHCDILGAYGVKH